MPNLSKKEKRMLLRILSSAVLLVILKILPEISLPFPIPFLSFSRVGEDGSVLFCLRAWSLYLIPYLTAGWDVLYRAIRNIRNGQVFDENFLMALATVGAFLTGEYAEAVFVMVFYQTGELFQDYAVGRSRASIAALMDICPETANLEREDGSVEEVDPEEVSVGDTIVIKPGERIPLDGVVTDGTSSLDTAALTGESAPREVRPGDTCLSGCVNGGGMLRVRVTKPFEDSTVAKILDLVENAGEKKARSEAFVTRFARYYTPCVVMAATALFLVPTLLLRFAPGLGLLAGTVWQDWLHRALIFLVISCPCALVISVPLSFFGGIGAASKCGILVKGSTYLESMAKAETVIFDKTGTLTQGVFTVSQVQPAEGFSKEALLESAALAEIFSDHPIALSLRTAWGAGLDAGRVTDAGELAGHGLRATVDGKTILAGNRRLMEAEHIAFTPSEVPGTIVYVAVDGVFAGHIVISDLPKDSAKKAISELHSSGVKRTVMLTGDSTAVAADVAKTLGIREFHAELLPGDKVSLTEEILAKKTPGSSVVFVGDGINDAPVLTRADVGVAMGALGSDAAIEAADIVLMDDDPAKLALAMGIARKTLAIVQQNIVFSLVVKGVVLILGAMNLASMWAAVFADVGVAVIAILNAMRCLRVKKS
ncbi:MAG: heavy metal translocating P-type ATPase [Oscillospiraceae bacterium]|nr:heavy metal translocating P-type ATPase [Oscillospiraceae bacterium]